MTGAYSDWLEERGSKWSRELDFNSVQKELHNNKCFSAMNESYCRGYCKKCSFSSPSEMQKSLRNGEMFGEMFLSSCKPYFTTG